MERQNLTLTASNLIDGIQDESVLWDTSIVATEEKELAWRQCLHLTMVFTNRVALAAPNPKSVLTVTLNLIPFVKKSLRFVTS